MTVQSQLLAQPEHVPLILIVDHDVDTRRMYNEYLTQGAQYAIGEAEDGREALAKVLSLRPDIVVTETRLPGISGYDLCSLLRTDAQTRDIPIVFVTGDAFASELRAESAGADAVLLKPCLPETLLVEMQRLLGQSAESNERAQFQRRRMPERHGRPGQLATSSHGNQLRRTTLSRAHVRHETTVPAIPPPTLVCPYCDQPLIYSHSNTGGVNARSAEQWDYFNCPDGCGTFQYRQRTRKIRKVD